ncbi:LPS assembly lipoprotein LptE [Legionella oakridgensis]|uniref:LPS-assembly lipoprotein LptE n=2 Tax=Legionella oakridgensis TaxID=29423 RepID=W0B9F4_9GAMM|nr:LPS assembly lipoprotein LptE [Legionella oakridgensis]AHE67183.1 rare lipoprotein B [Legionella oakridgensis ATCC 33761 = DSM 21215]
MRYNYLTCLLLLLLTGCGFHLRGMVDMPPWLDRVAIINQSEHRELEQLLAEQLQAYHVDVSSDPASAHYWLFLQNDSFQQQIASVSSSTTPRQYQLIYTVQFKLQQAKGKEIIPSGQLVITRQLTVNSDRILGSDEEEAIIKREMRRDAALQMLYRLSRYQAS